VLDGTTRSGCQLGVLPLVAIQPAYQTNACHAFTIPFISYVYRFIH
jgi:hypothetical protein